MEKYDLTIIGAGPGGYVAGIYAGIKGVKTCLIEEDKLGGVCLNYGCIPTKFLLHGSEIFKSIKEADKWGISVSNFELNYEILNQKKNEIVSGLVNGVDFLLKKRGVNVIRGKARIKDKNLISVKLKDGKLEEIPSDYIVIATGSKPVEIKGLEFDDKNILSSRQILDLNYLPQSLLIVGGGVIGVEFATHFARFGIHVYIVELMDRILPKEEREISKTLELNLKKMGVKIFTSTKVKEIEKNEKGIKVKLENGKDFEVEKILVAVSRKANIENLYKDLNFELEKGFIKVDEHLKTNIEDIYAIGDVKGGFMLAHTASYEAKIAVDNIKGGKKAPDYSVVPSCIFTEPEIATVGLKELEAKGRGYDLIVAKFPFRALGKARAIQETEGFIKLIADKKTKMLLGAHLIGHSVTEIINELSMAIKFEIPYTEISDLIHPHPTIGEAILEAIEILNNKPIHFI
jgi:dihydrolipoamide dehydrogenase